MIKKFECKECGNRFDADDENAVKCPKCSSDNVEYASFRVPSLVWKIIAVIVILGGIIFLLKDINWNSAYSQQGNPEGYHESGDSTRFDSIYEVETGLKLPPEIKVGALTFEEDGYTFNVKVENIKNSNIFYAVLDPYNDKKIISKCDDGKFTNIPYSKYDGAIYTIAIFDAANDTIICKKEQVTGFIKQMKVSKKMTEAELQQKIQQRDSSLMGAGENNYLSPNYKLILIGLSESTPNKPKILSDVFEKLDMGTWSDVSVKSLKYDDMNRISEITLEITKSDDLF